MKSTNITFHKGSVTYEDRCKNTGHFGLVVWLTGLSGSGKSTIAVRVENMLCQMGKTVYRLDGDNIRFGLNGDLGFSHEDRQENIRRISEVAALFKDAGVIVIASFISPLQSMRDFAREKSGAQFIEAYVKADIDTCAQRDPKGLYKKAMAGEIKDFTGLTAPYEEPRKPDVVLDTMKHSPDQCARMLLDEINKKTIF